MREEQKQTLIGQAQQRYEAVAPYLSERAKRIWAASEALVVGDGGATIVCEATGISRVRISSGKKEIRSGVGVEVERVRRRGGGRKKLTSCDPAVLNDLDALIDPCTRGDPQSPLSGLKGELLGLKKCKVYFFLLPNGASIPSAVQQ